MLKGLVGELGSKSLEVGIVGFIFVYPLHVDLLPEHPATPSCSHVDPCAQARDLKLGCLHH